MSENHHQFWRRLLTALLALSLGLVSWLSLSPSMAPPEAFDKILHTLAWCGVFWVAALAQLTWQASLWRVASLATAVFLGSVALEIGQHFVPGRQASLLDALANLLGILLGALLVAWLLKFRRRGGKAESASLG